MLDAGCGTGRNLFYFLSSQQSAALAGRNKRSAATQDVRSDYEKNAATLHRGIQGFYSLMPQGR
jgi:hypothetical protein